MIIQSAFLPPPLPSHSIREELTQHIQLMVTKKMVEYLLVRCSNRSVPGEDRMGAEIDHRQDTAGLGRGPGHHLVAEKPARES